MKYRYIIQEPYDGTYKGTNDLDVANKYATSEDYFVYDTETGEWILSDLKRQELEEIK